MLLGKPHKLQETKLERFPKLDAGGSGVPAGWDRRPRPVDSCREILSTSETPGSASGRQVLQQTPFVDLGGQATGLPLNELSEQH